MSTHQMMIGAFPMTFWLSNGKRRARFKMVRCAYLVAIGFALFATTAIPAEAAPIQAGDAYNVAFSAVTCVTCWGAAPIPNVTVEGLLTVVPVSGGQFWDPWYGAYFSGSEMVIGLTGSLTIDCNGISSCEGNGTYSLSFRDANPVGDGWSAPLGDGSWLMPSFVPRYVVFSAGGSGLDTRFINDNANNLFQWESSATRNGTQVPVAWSAVRVPESSSVALLALGLIGMALFRLNAGERQKS